MGSIGGRSALPFLGPYAASKHALEALADVLRLKLATRGIAGASILEPASVKTAIWTKGAAHADALRGRRFRPRRPGSRGAARRVLGRSR